MNLGKFARSRPLEEIERSNLFMATVDGSKVFYAIKAFGIRENGSDDDLIVCLGPPSHLPWEVSGPCIFNASVLGGHPVLDLHEHLQLIPSMKVEEAKTLDDGPMPGDLVFVQDKILLVVETGGRRMGHYFNLKEGKITKGLREPHGFIIKSWKLQTTDPVMPETVLSFPYEES